MVLSLAKLCTDYISRNSQRLVKCFHFWLDVREGMSSTRNGHFRYSRSHVKMSRSKPKAVKMCTCLQTDFAKHVNSHVIPSRVTSGGKESSILRETFWGLKFTALGYAEYGIHESRRYQPTRRLQLFRSEKVDFIPDVSNKKLGHSHEAFSWPT